MNQVYNRIESITGNVITVRADGVRYHELAQIRTRFGKSLAEVIKIDGDLVSLQVFAGRPGRFHRRRGALFEPRDARALQR